MILATRRLFLLLTLCLLMYAAGGGVNDLFGKTAIFLSSLIILMCIIDILLLTQTSQLTLHRSCADKLSINQPASVLIQIRNKSPRTFQCAIQDCVPSQFEVTPSPPLFNVKVDGNSTKSCSYDLMPLRRGSFQLDEISCRIEGPFGFVQRQLVFREKTKMKIYPDLSNIKAIGGIECRLLLKPFGFRKTRLPGEGTNFDHLRDYNYDDDIRWVDWNATARHNRPISRAYETDRHQTIHIVLDAGRLMANKVDAHLTKFDYCLNTAVILSHVAIHQGDLIGVMSFAGKVLTFVPPGNGMSQVKKITEAVYDIHPLLTESNFEQAFTYIRAHQRRRALIVIFTDIQDKVTAGRFLNYIALLRPTHLPLIVTISNEELLKLARKVPQDIDEMFTVGAASELLIDREEVLAELASKGALMVDCPAQHINTRVIREYLDIKSKNKL